MNCKHRSAVSFHRGFGSLALDKQKKFASGKSIEKSRPCVILGKEQMLCESISTILRPLNICSYDWASSRELDKFRPRYSIY